jgi:hypothetical protein
MQPPHPILRRTLNQNGKSKNKIHRSKRECVAVLIEKQYEDNLYHEDQPLKCELQGEDLNGDQYMMVQVKGLDSSWARKNNVTSGVTTIFVPNGADIDDETRELVIPSKAEIKVRGHFDTSMQNRMD